MSNGAPPEPGASAADNTAVTLFIDRDTWSYLLDAALRAEGIPFVAHRELFEPATPDTLWIEEVAAVVG